MPKRILEPLVVQLEEAAGPVRWLRATITREEKNKRDGFCISLHSGSPYDETCVPANISGRTQISLKISDRDYQESGMDRCAYSTMRILRAVAAAALAAGATTGDINLVPTAVQTELPIERSGNTIVTYLAALPVTNTYFQYYSHLLCFTTPPL